MIVQEQEFAVVGVTGGGMRASTNRQPSGEKNVRLKACTPPYSHPFLFYFLFFSVVGPLFPPHFFSFFFFSFIFSFRVLSPFVAISGRHLCAAVFLDWHFLFRPHVFSAFHLSVSCFFESVHFYFFVVFRRGARRKK